MNTQPQTVEQVEVEVGMLRTRLDELDRQMFLLIKEREIVAVRFRLAMGRAAQIKKPEVHYVGGTRIES